MFTSICSGGSVSAGRSSIVEITPVPPANVDWRMRTAVSIIGMTRCRQPNKANYM
ncbi:hypothetical protein BN903_129 [Halorubrum sp. AJ67]|nr:hypothetical protein BN903_129 [Halorubrum sp. AJ67]